MNIKKEAKPQVSKQYFIPTLMSPGHNYGLNKYFYTVVDFSHLLVTSFWKVAQNTPTPKALNEYYFTDFAEMKKEITINRRL